MNDVTSQLRTFLRLLYIAKWFFTILGSVVVIAASYSAYANLAGIEVKNTLTESIVFLTASLAFVLVAQTVLPRAMRSTTAAAADQIGPKAWEQAARYGLRPLSAAEMDRVRPKPRIDLPFEAVERVFWEGRRVSLEFSPCVVHTAGDFTGNLDVAVRSTPRLPVETIVDNLRLRIPAHDALLGVMGHAEMDKEVEVSFSLCNLAAFQIDDLIGWERDTASTLTKVELWWGKSGERKLATVSCTRAATS